MIKSQIPLSYIKFSFAENKNINFLLSGIFQKTHNFKILRHRKTNKADKKNKNDKMINDKI